MKTPEFPPRYEMEYVRLTMAQTILRWIRGLRNLKWDWTREEFAWKVITVSDAGYQNASFEMHLTMNDCDVAVRTEKTK